ncbi:MAG: hypothetical protein IT385_12415 [Deltaproteobacteria bacterium]|nr:hypothetical protein [Deltaproteobacteria bacterium]
MIVPSRPLVSSSLVALLTVAACGKKEPTPPTTAAPTTAAPTTAAPTTAAAKPDATTAPEPDAAAPPATTAAPTTTAAPEDAATPEPTGDDDEPKGDPLPTTSPYHPVCAAHAKAGEHEEGWQCRVERELQGGKGALAEVAILRFTHFDLGMVDQRILAFKGDKGWALGPDVVDTSVSGVGGVNARGKVAEASLALAGNAPLLVVRSEEVHGDSDMGVNAYTMVEVARLTVCTEVEGAPRCATLPTAITRELSKIDAEGETPPPEYGPVGKTSWSRPVTIEPDGTLVVGQTEGKIDPLPPELSGRHALKDVVAKALPGVAVWPE